jgi:hypothetical protein
MVNGDKPGSEISRLMAIAICDRASGAHGLFEVGSIFCQFARLRDFFREHFQVLTYRLW